jgi:hypothetical protein
MRHSRGSPVTTWIWLQAGHFGIPQTAEWDQRMTSTWEQIKLGF